MCSVASRFIYARRGRLYRPYTGKLYSLRWQNLYHCLSKFPLENSLATKQILTNSKNFYQINQTVLQSLQFRDRGRRRSPRFVRNSLCRAIAAYAVLCCLAKFTIIIEPLKYVTMNLNDMYFVKVSTITT